MDAYMYQATMLCANCADAAAKAALAAGASDDGESDRFPQGPYDDGGGEADCPNHCGECGVFLENSLTSDGYGYVAQTIVDDLAAGRFDSVAITEWASFYDLGGIQEIVEALAPKVEVRAPRAE